MNQNPKLFFYFFAGGLGLFALILVGSFLFIKNTPIQLPLRDSSLNQNSNSSNENANTNLGNFNSNKDYSNLSIPILMYHYIRVVDDPNDQLGRDLSVTPVNFQKQLDEIKALGYTTTTFQEIENGNLPEKPIILTFDDGYQDFYTNAYPVLKQMRMTAVSFIIVNDRGDEYMTGPEIKEISDYGIEIGSHTLNHLDLSKIDDVRATKEITESKNELEKLTNKAVISFCYPSGKFNDSSIRITGETGYKFATTTKSGLAALDDPLQLDRYRMKNETKINNLLE